ncbi:MAG TPA: helix-turn-helix domain-containing protein [Spirochaetota bacterium]|nr:helix-turn-helix domain-containing protein [Spirochaetota bacterium]HPF07350.1 helix-turn-helix domain-containing protein [Spirochaetota bacterium]HPJ43736.1 helix-turn-helix domain-containing protein [Spirochaetota bacterium]HPR38765.1 helix-turn-helix domain-containing protein [Spirochaetota bacterium]
MAFGEFIYLFLMFFVPLFLIIIALGQLAEKDKEFFHYIFALSFTGQGLWEIQIILYSTRAFPELYWLIMALIPVSYVVIPLLLIRYTWIFSTDYRFYRRHIFFFIPAILAALYCLVPLFFPGVNFRGEHLMGVPVFSNEFYSLPVYSKFLYFNMIISKLVLLILMSVMLFRFYKISKYSKSIKLSAVFRIGYVFAILITVMTLICLAGDFFSMKIVRGSVFIANIFICSVYIVSRRHPSYNRMLKIEIEKAAYSHSYIKGIDIEFVVSSLNRLMTEDKAFADEDITLKKLADELDITTHQLSQILNERIKKNFSTFINEFRINEAKDLLIEEPDRSILSISIAVGFNSYTTFCTTFSKMAGVSPSQYRKDNRKK